MNNKMTDNQTRLRADGSAEALSASELEVLRRTNDGEQLNLKGFQRLYDQLELIMWVWRGDRYINVLSAKGRELLAQASANATAAGGGKRGNGGRGGEK